MGHDEARAAVKWTRLARCWGAAVALAVAGAASPGIVSASTTVAVDAGAAGAPSSVQATGFTGSEWSVIRFTDYTGNFVESGYIDISAYLVAGGTVQPSGHSLYAKFDVNSTGLSTATLYAAQGKASFGFDATTGAATVALEAGASPVALAAGFFSAMAPANSANGLGFTAVLTFTQLSGLSIDLPAGRALTLNIAADHPFSSTTPYSEVTALTAPVGEGGSSVMVGYRVVGGSDTLSFAVSAVPEPAQWAQWLLGSLLILAVWQGRRAQRPIPPARCQLGGCSA
ncbi:hypothetical protein ACG04R_20300 [Roseateles sp. BYS78W]|uniref:PEP-CTERM protein-sorting domain-containing protein n=1 Tax=Pelomonas candidula TaxID=3299025 RepID=A0ABW7HGJ9_9BURK